MEQTRRRHSITKRTESPKWCVLETMSKMSLILQIHTTCTLSLHSKTPVSSPLLPSAMPLCALCISRARSRTRGEQRAIEWEQHQFSTSHMNVRRLAKKGRRMEEGTPVWLNSSSRKDESAWAFHPDQTALVGAAPAPHSLPRDCPLSVCCQRRNNTPPPLSSGLQGDRGEGDAGGVAMGRHTGLCLLFSVALGRLMWRKACLAGDRLRGL